jgi:UDPglucose--hexose-1-phosphate uridylyltransferase
MGIETSPSDNMLPTCSAFGIHDVVIECPDSRQRLADLNAQEVTWILTAWQTRIRQLTADPRIMHAAIFRNEGFSAGASLAHCHSQIIASTVSPPLIEARTQRSRDHRERTGRDLTADWLESERRDGRRILHDDSCLTVLCPFAPRTSWHVRIVPDASRNGSSVNAAVVPFESIQTADRKSLAVLLSAVVRTLQEHLGPFPFNVVVTMPPFSDPNAFGWMIDVLPRTSRIAGWEYLTDVDIVSTSPEHATAVLRERFQSIVQEELLSRPGSVSEAAVQPADQIVVAENPPSTTMF